MTLQKTLQLCLVLMVLSGCKSIPASTASEPQVTDEPAPTEAPMAARVNGQGVLMADYEAEMRRYQAGMSASDQEYDQTVAKQAVLDFLIDQALLAQGAVEMGYTADDTALQSRYDGLAADVGGQDALNTWMDNNFFTEESFRSALARDMAVVWMRNKIAADVPMTADQVLARQILVINENEATAVERQLQVGKSFETLAFEYDPLTGGDLGWFPVGYLLQPDVEKAAFALQPGQFSGIIPTSYGFHVVYVIERDGQHPLSPEALQMVQRENYEKWLADQRAKSSIEILAP